MLIKKKLKYLGYVSLPGKVRILEFKNFFKFIPELPTYFLVFQICFIQPFMKHKVYATARLSTEAKTVSHHYRLQRSKLGRHTYK